MWCGFSIVFYVDASRGQLVWSRGDGVIGSDHVQRSPGKILNQDRPMLVRNVPCLHSCEISEISLLEGTVSNNTHVSAEIRKLG